MANKGLNPMLQEYGTGDELALALTQYSGITLASYHLALVAGQFGLHKGVTQGNSFQFPAFARAEAEEHTAGTELLGNNQPESEDRQIPVDLKQLMSHRYFDEVQQFISHFDTRSQAAIEHGQAVARKVDKRMFQMIQQGANEAARGTGFDAFPAGQRVQASTAGAVTTAYPRTLTGSRRFQDDLEEIGRDMDDDNVPDNMRVAFVTPYLRDVLLQDKTIVSRDFQDPNTMLTQKIVMINRFRIVQTNNLPTTNLTTGESAYRGNYTKVVSLCIGDKTAFGQVTFGGGIREIPIEWIADKQSWLQGAKILQGTKWLRPEACGEIYLQ